VADHPIRQYPDELRAMAETDMLHAHPTEAGELTAEEARDLADDLGLQLYRALDALAFVEECCVIAERTGRPITVADVREWLKGAQCGRQLAAGGESVVDPAAPPVHLVTWTGPANNAEQCPRTTPDNSVASSDAADIAHVYLSTGCLHGQHDYCSNVDGIAGLKKPAQCKFCTAPCHCPCHAVAS
jgi:hypothetical protein